MNRIRVGLIGLSTTSDSTSWASRAHLPYLLSEVGKKHYEIVALCNTSIEKGKKSIEQYNLPSSTKTYDSVTKLAADKDIDLIVNVTGVQQHYPLLKPAIEAGKDVFTELPLASDMGKCYELAQLAKEKGVKTVFGMQGQTSPVVMTIKRLIDEGKIGRVLSSTWTGAAVFMGERPIPKNHSAFLDRATGANLSTIGFLHTINYILAALGEIKTLQSLMASQRSTFGRLDPATKQVTQVPYNTPDQIMLLARLTSGCVLSYHLRGGDAFPGTPGMTWSIYGEKGEIRITNPMSPMDIMHAGCSISLQTFGPPPAMPSPPGMEDRGHEVQDIPIGSEASGSEPGGSEADGSKADGLDTLPHPAQNVGRIYEAFAAGKRSREGEAGGYPGWDVAIRRHELIEEMWRRWDAGGAVAEGEGVGTWLKPES